jgi:hypothetical protein
MQDAWILFTRSLHIPKTASKRMAPRLWTWFVTRPRRRIRRSSRTSPRVSAERHEHEPVSSRAALPQFTDPDRFHQRTLALDFRRRMFKESSSTESEPGHVSACALLNMVSSSWSRRTSRLNWAQDGLRRGGAGLKLGRNEFRRPTLTAYHVLRCGMRRRAVPSDTERLLDYRESGPWSAAEIEVQVRNTLLDYIRAGGRGPARRTVRGQDRGRVPPCARAHATNQFV